MRHVDERSDWHRRARAAAFGFSDVLDFARASTARKRTNTPDRRQRMERGQSERRVGTA